MRRTRAATAVAALLGLLLAGVRVEAAEYYVDARVPTSGNGSIGSPFKTIQEGINRLAPGDVLWVRGDAGGLSYRESLSLPVSGAAGQPITVRAYPEERVVLTGSSGARLSIGRDHWVFDGLVVDQANVSADAIKVNANHVVLRRMEIRNGQREGVAIERASFVTIEESYIHDFMWISSSGGRNDAHCIMIDTSASASISNIVVRRNVIERCSGDGTQVFGETGQSIASYAKSLEFTDNTFIDGTSSAGLTENALDFKAVDGVLVRGNTMVGYRNNKTIVAQKGSRNVTIDGNVLADGLSGIEMRQEGGLEFLQLNNRITRNVIRGMATYAIKLDGLVNAVVANNTLADIGEEPFRFDSSLGSSVPSVQDGAVKNNLVFDAGDSPAGAGNLSGVDVGYNGWFQASAGGLGRATDTSGSDPRFVSVGAHDYRLTASSPAIDRGSDVGLPFVGSAPDLGAFEFAGGDVQAPNPPTGLRVQ